VNKLNNLAEVLTAEKQHSLGIKLNGGIDNRHHIVRNQTA